MPGVFPDRRVWWPAAGWWLGGGAAVGLGGRAFVAWTWAGGGGPLFDPGSLRVNGIDPAGAYRLLLAAYLFVGLLLTGATAVVALARRRGWDRLELAERLLRWGCPVVCWFVYLWALWSEGYEGYWYPLEAILTLQGPEPFQHRLLFLPLARAFGWLAPSLSAKACVLLSQAVATALAVYFVQRFAGHWTGPRLAWLASLLLAARLAPTIVYYNLYDPGTVALSAAALWCLARQRDGAYLICLTLGLLNHEVAALLIPVAVVSHWRAGLDRRRMAVLLALQLGLAVTIRFGLPALLHISGEPFEAGKFWFNIGLMGNRDSLLRALGSLLPWWAMTAACAPLAPSALRWMLLLWPLLTLQMIFFGQGSEVRVFHLMVPVEMAVIAHGARAVLGLPEPPPDS